MLTIEEPSFAEWFAAGTAAAAIAVVLAFLLLRPVLRRSVATVWGRVGGLLLATVATGLLVVVVSVAAISVEAGGDGAVVFSALFDGVDSTTVKRLAGYVAALLVPLAAVVAVLAVAVVDLGRNTGLRIVAGVASGVVLATGIVIGIGDTGTAPTVVAWTIAALAGGAGIALAVDEFIARGSS